MQCVWRTNLVAAPDFWFLMLNNGLQPPDFQRAQLLHRGIHSRVLSHPDRPGLVSKLARPRSMPRDALRRYVNCQGKREFLSTRWIKALGLRAPEVLGYGIAMSPFDRYDSLVFMRMLDNFQSLKHILRTRPEGARCGALVTQAAAEMGLIYRHGLHLNDSHFGNILVSDNGTVIWIDNDIRRSSGFKRQRQRLHKALMQLRSSSRKYLYDDEWRCYKNSLRASLSETGRGARLANEVLGLVD